MPFFKENKNNLELQFSKPNVNFLVDEDSEVIKLYKLVNKLGFTEFYKKYPEKGAVAYKPEVIFTVILLSIMEGTFSSRAIERKCQRDVYYIYLTEYRKPDHSTIARFIQKFRQEIINLLPQVIKLGKENKISSFNSIAIDGSKFQSKSSKKHSMKMKDLEEEEKLLSTKLEKLINLIHENDKKEDRNEEKQKRLQEEKKRIERKKEVVENAKVELENRKKKIHKKDREKHQINLVEPDARMMHDLEANGYNIQLSVDTESELIVNATVETDRSDHHQFSKQHQIIKTILEEDPNRAYIADAGYTSTETNDYIKDKNVNAYINSREIKEYPSVDELLERNKLITSDFFVFSRKDNEYRCPNNQKLKEITPGVYEAAGCDECKIKHLCITGKESQNKGVRRKITRTLFSSDMEIMKKKVKDNPEMMNKRKAVERKFGDIKWNLGFRRFRRKGIVGASVEIMMIVLALNLKKLIQLPKFLYNLISFISRAVHDVALAYK
jgi:transposase